MTPRHLSANPRVVKEAAALTDAGHSIHIVHGHYAPPDAARDATVANPTWTITRVVFGPRLSPKATYFRQTLVRRSAGFAARWSALTGRLAEVAIEPSALDLAAAVRKVPANLYMAHYDAALPAVARAARHHNARYTFDAEDFHEGDLPDLPEHAPEKRIICAIERQYLPGAAYVTAASPLIADAYADTYGIPRPTVILNVFPKANAPIAPTPKGSARPGPSLYWFSQTIGPGRGLETALEAIGRAKSKPHLYLRGTPAAGYDAHLRRAAANSGLADRLHFLAPAPPGELERLGAEYDIGYVGELAETRNRLIALTNKLFSYLLGGVPSLSSDIPAHRQLAPDLGEAMTLFPIGDAHALAAALDGFLLDDNRLAAARGHAWRLGQTRFNWDAEQKHFIEKVSSVVSN